MRPISITITDSLKAIAHDFQLWTKSNWGTAKRNEVGPSGYERRSSLSIPQEADLEQQQLSQMIEEDDLHYSPYREMKYADDGETPGLLRSKDRENWR